MPQTPAAFWPVAGACPAEVAGLSPPGAHRVFPGFFSPLRFEPCRSGTREDSVGMKPDTAQIEKSSDPASSLPLVLASYTLLGYGLESQNVLLRTFHVLTFRVLLRMAWRLIWLLQASFRRRFGFRQRCASIERRPILINRRSPVLLEIK